MLGEIFQLAWGVGGPARWSPSLAARGVYGLQSDAMQHTDSFHHADALMLIRNGPGFTGIASAYREYRWAFTLSSLIL